VNGLVRLTRYKEYPFFVMVTSLLGVSAGNGFFGWKFVGVLAANTLAVAFAFMINDVEDAPDDALDPVKAERNPVSAADLSATTGRVASFGVALTAGILYSVLGLWPFVTGFSSLVIAYLYSWRRIRLKSMPFADLVSHCLMLAGFQFLSAYFTFEAAPLVRWLIPFIFILTISMYGELFQELRDLEVDRKAGVTHTTSLIGQRAAYWLMMGLFLIGVGSGLATIFIIRLLFTWSLLLLMIFAAILVVPALMRIRRHSSQLGMQQSFQKPIEIAAAFALVLQFVVPWAAKFF